MPVLLLVHGYYSPRERVLKAYNEIAANLFINHLDYLVIGFTWPAGSNFLHYNKAKNRTEQTSSRLEYWIRLFSDHASSVDVNTHSLGARVLFYALRNYSINVRNVFALAPAVDNECLESGEKFDAVPSKCRNLMVFHSRRDPVLKYAYLAGDFDQALGNNGPANPSKVPPNVKCIDCTSFVKSHGGYKSRPEVYEQMASGVLI
jgi:esterase/lipase superfamily enzyme